MRKNKIFTMILSGAIILSGTSFEAYGSEYLQRFREKAQSALSLAKGRLSSAAGSLSSSIADAPKSFANFVSKLSWPTKRQLFIAVGTALIGKENFEKQRIAMVQIMLDKILAGEWAVEDLTLSELSVWLPQEMSNSKQWIEYAKLLTDDDVAEAQKFCKAMGDKCGAKEKTIMENLRNEKIAEYLMVLHDIINKSSEVKNATSRKMIADLEQAQEVMLRGKLNKESSQPAAAA